MLNNIFDSDIIAEIKKPGRDPREEGIKPILRTDVLKIEDINFETENRTIFYFEDNSNVIDKNNIIKNGYNIQKVYEGNIDIQQWNGLILDRYNFSVYKIEK